MFRRNKIGSNYAAGTACRKSIGGTSQVAGTMSGPTPHSICPRLGVAPDEHARAAPQPDNQAFGPPLPDKMVGQEIHNKSGEAWGPGRPQTKNVISEKSPGGAWEGRGSAETAASEMGTWRERRWDTTPLSRYGRKFSPSLSSETIQHAPQGRRIARLLP